MILQDLHKKIINAEKDVAWERIDLTLDQQIAHAIQKGTETAWNQDRRILKMAEVELESRHKAKKS